MVSFHPEATNFYYDTLNIANNSLTPLIQVALLGAGITNVTRFNDHIPEQYSLSQNYPNPFNPSTAIRYGLPNTSFVSLKIYNVLGQLITELVNTEQQAGWYEVTWNAHISSGLYFYRIDAAGGSESSKKFSSMRKMILLK